MYFVLIYHGSHVAVLEDVYVHSQLGIAVVAGGDSGDAAIRLSSSLSVSSSIPTAAE